MISPKVAGSVPDGPWIEVTTPLFLARKAGSLLHCGQFGMASFRRPAISSRMKLDQITIAALPGEVRRPGGVDVLGAGDRVVLLQVP